MTPDSSKPKTLYLTIMGIAIDAFTHGNLENLSHVYPAAFNLGFEGVG